MRHGTKVAVYWNFNKKCFSVINKATGKVEAYAREVYLDNVKFSVGQKGRARVLKEKRKNVHAKIHGTLMGMITIDNSCYSLTPEDFQGSFTRLTYNPYRHSQFVEYADETQQWFEAAGCALITHAKKGLIYV